MASENTRWLAIGLDGGGWLARLMSVWQPLQPIAPWTDCAKLSPEICNESVVPFASGLSNPAASWQPRHCWSPAEGAATATGAVIPASANRVVITTMLNALRPIEPRAIRPPVGCDRVVSIAACRAPPQ